MEEQIPKEEEKAQPEASNEATEGNLSAIDLANLAAERMEKANKEKEKLLKIEEKLLIERKLSGTSEAGKNVQEKHEETPEEYKERIMKGQLS